ncbi:DUF349 domain-containing protein [Reichenbachiella ulvae]|uniref:DUF349 domain-containing protein n=1 Tax=Reichenbachiella ulvae TaxID=2980104 RepID=A0ABT3CS32_9BACT|nr:DUF349 domain-containing protein [Reichenbachiella ulvae]MCV9386363.1 DUF349 domain-containing protein [Reichenbachiella ulvae]
MSDKKEIADNDAEKVLKPDAVQQDAELNEENNNQESTPEAEATPAPEPEKEVVAEPEPVPEAETAPVTEAPADPVSEETTATEAPEPKAEEPETPQSEAPKSETPQSEAADTEDSDDEDDHKDHDELHADQHDDEVDYSKMSKSELLEHIAQLSKDEEGFKRGRTISAIKDSFDNIFEKEKDDALARFIKDGGEEDDFDYHLDEDSEKFYAYHKILREKRYHNAKELEKQKERNLKLKIDLLEKLREFVDNDENTASINELRAMQEEWKAIGPVHPQHNKTLWANYNALLDRYYDHRSIYFELKELDKKKNLEAKQELCVQAEELVKSDNLNEAIKRLNELHEEYKHIGPVPKEVQEETWQRFKSASDEIYQKRKEYYGQLKEEFKDNLEKKTALAESIQVYNDFDSDKIGEWNEKTKELLAIQKQWDAIGSMPKENAKEINKMFWGAFKGFFKNKSAFFKSLDSKREENLQVKEELVAKAAELAKSDDWEGTANKLKDLQKEWKNIGPVPEKQRDSIYKKFKAACDEFFTRRREHNKSKESDYEVNLKQKEEVCEKLEALAEVEDFQPEAVYELQDAFNEIGFVPKKAIKAIQNRYQTALRGVINNAKHFDSEELDELKSLISIHKIKAGPHGDQKLQRKEHSLKRKISNLENDISTWKNNIGFFANSKNANEMLKDFEEKIQKAENQLEELKEELKLIQYAE